MEQFPSFVLKSRVLNKLVRVLHQTAPKRFFKELGNPASTPLQRLGSDYGGWFTPTEVKKLDLLVLGNRPICNV